ncbi:MAG: Rne/Rng family ribonuclease, partial [Desulfobacteraceae bacterium]|nr:Rne/Rng family ribonuclease [Desulfobacteraceae bacterium]
QDNESGKNKLSNLIKKGQELIVQIIKDPIAHKGAMLTTYVSLPGRLVVLMPGNNTKGVSRQIDDEKERKRLAGIAGKLKIHPGFGIIIRTVGKGSNKTMLTNDLKYLMRIWKNIDKKAMKQKAPSLLYQEQNLAVRTLRDYFTNDIIEILIDDPTVFKEVKDFISIIAPKSTKKVKKYNGDKPIFTKHQLEDQISSIFKKKVGLPSGGELVIDQTEALVAIDVNSGKSTKKKNIEETAFHTNLEAAEEVGRQLRLRDLGGLIVIDFIDMREKKHKSEITKKIKLNLKSDKAKTKVGGLSQFGLLEMSRQRLRPAITFGSFETCSHCDGRGQIPSIKAQTTAFLRQINLKSIKKDIHNLTGIVPEDVASYLLNKKRDELLNIETKHKVTISIEGDRKINAGDNKIIIN